MNEIEKLIKIASDEVGYLEKKSNAQLDNKTANAGHGNYTKYARDIDALKDFYNGPKQGFPWCDVFVDWCFVQAFGKERAMELLNQPKKSTGAGCGFSMDFYKQAGRLYKNPKPGDQVFFKQSGEITHTGLVYKVDNSKVYTIEGNTSSASGVVPNGGAVAKKSYNLASGYLAGFGRSLFIEEEIKPAPAPTPKPTDKTKDGVMNCIFDIQEWLNNNYGFGIAEDNTYGPETEHALVKALQIELNIQTGANLTPDGMFGPLTKEACIVVTKGAHGNITMLIQMELFIRKYKIDMDKSFGSETFKTVKSFQKAAGLKVDGKVGPETFEKLFK